MLHGKRTMSQGQKRVIDQDPDYESIPLHAQQKRIKLHEQDAKEAAVKKIEQIVRSQFSSEISARESELDLINQRIYQLQMMLDRLRVGIITKYYASGGQAADSCSAVSGGGWEDSQQALASVHPTVRQFLGKAPLATPRSEECHSGSQEEQRRTFVTEDSSNVETTAAPGLGAEASLRRLTRGACPATPCCCTTFFGNAVVEQRWCWLYVAGVNTKWDRVIGEK
ncbi:hypothetical protein V5799_022585 [Amblyomma americanum]|uniref:Uncharacterized protein n=1 Tax=Amblyomma americanum TaxID=6943 RepID=A0AAQ4FLL6_AMBAM